MHERGSHHLGWQSSRGSCTSREAHNQVRSLLFLNSTASPEPPPSPPHLGAQCWQIPLKSPNSSPSSLPYIHLPASLLLLSYWGTTEDAHNLSAGPPNVFGVFVCFHSSTPSWAQDQVCALHLDILDLPAMLPPSTSTGPDTVPSWVCSCGPDLLMPRLQALSIPPPPTSPHWAPNCPSRLT